MAGNSTKRQYFQNQKFEYLKPQQILRIQRFRLEEKSTSRKQKSSTEENLSNSAGFGQKIPKGSTAKTKKSDTKTGKIFEGAKAEVSEATSQKLP